MPLRSISASASSSSRSMWAPKDSSTGASRSSEQTSARERRAMMSTSPSWSMCWCVMTIRSRSSIRRPCVASARSSSSSALPEFGPVSTSVSGSSSISQQFTRPTANGVGIASRWTPAAAAVASGSGTDHAQDLVALGLHVLPGDERLEVEPQQRLRVGRAHVEVPVLVVDGDAVQPRHLAVAVALRQLVHLGLLVEHLGVDLAGDEVLRPEALQQLVQRRALMRQQLQDQQRRD